MSTSPYFFQNAPSWGSQNIAGYGDSGEEGEWDQQTGMQRGFTGQDIGQGIAGGLSAGAANSQPIGDFNIDQYAGFKGSGQGLAAGGPIAAALGGITAQVGQFRNVNENLRNLNTSVDSVTYDAYGRPVYQGSNLVNAQQNLNELDSGINKLNKTHLDPATNLFSSAFGTRRRMKRKRAELSQGIQSAQQQYNQAEQNFRNQSIQRSEYYDRLNDRSRLYNLYRYT